MKTLNALSHSTKLAVTVVTVLLLSACGNKSSDPLADYQGVNLTKRDGNTPQPDQEIGKHPLRIQLAGSSNSNSKGGMTTFNEGATNSLNFVVISDDQNVNDIEVVIPNQPAGSRLTRKGTSFEYELIWAPGQGTTGSEEGIPFPIQIQARVTSARIPSLVQDYGQTSFAKLDHTLFVQRNSTKPTIVETLEFPSEKAGIDEGSRVEFTVVVEDKASNPGQFPKLFKADYVSNEAQYVDGSAYVSRVDQVPTLIEGTKKWKFKYAIDTRGRDLPVAILDRTQSTLDPKADRLRFCVKFQALGVTGKPAANEIDRCSAFNYAAQTPTVIWTDKGDTPKLKVGEPITLSADVKASKNVGLFEINEKQVLKLQGATWECPIQSSSYERKCTLNWTPQCDTQLRRVESGRYELRFEVSHKVGNRAPKTRIEQRFIEVHDKENKCGRSKSRATTPTANNSQGAKK